MILSQLGIWARSTTYAALLVHNHANILTTWIHLTYIALQGHQACLQSFYYFEKHLNMSLYWKMQKKSLTTSCMNSFDQFFVNYFLSVCEWHCSGWKDWCWTTENVGQNMQLNTICFVNTMAPSLKAPYTILANCIFTPLPRDCNHWLQSILANFQIWLPPSARPVQNLHTFGEGSWQMLVSSLIACSQKRVIKSIELT